MKKITKKKLIDIIAKTTKTNPLKVSDSTNDKNLKSWDSMNHIKIIIELEKLVGIKIQFKDTLKLTSVKQILNFLKKKMLFNSFEYLFIFLPILLFIYYYINFKINYTKIVLIIFGLFFYSYWNINFLPILLFSIIINYLNCKKNK